MPRGDRAIADHCASTKAIDDAYATALLEASELAQKAAAEAFSAYAAAPSTEVCAPSISCRGRAHRHTPVHDSVQQLLYHWRSPGPFRKQLSDHPEP